MKKLLAFSIICITLIVGIAMTKKEKTQPPVKSYKAYQHFIPNEPTFIKTEPPSVRAFLDTIAYSEGTFYKYGYHDAFAHHYIDDLEKMERTKYYFTTTHGKRQYTTAQGRYQYLWESWHRLAKGKCKHSRTKWCQDSVAINDLKARGIYRLIMAGDIRGAMHKSHNCWVSFPPRTGGSKYHQPTRKIDDLLRFYNQRLKTYEK